MFTPCIPIRVSILSPARYIRALHTYLVSFTRRAQPLIDVETQQKQAEAEFTSKWDAGEISGWEEERPNKPAVNGNGEGIWCAACKCSPLHSTITS